jgi:hypothetical protein
MRTTIDEKSFHALQSTTPRMLTQGNNTQTKHRVDHARPRVV